MVKPALVQDLVVLLVKAMSDEQVAKMLSDMGIDEAKPYTLNVYNCRDSRSSGRRRDTHFAGAELVLRQGESKARLHVKSDLLFDDSDVFVKAIHHFAATASDLDLDRTLDGAGVWVAQEFSS